VDAMKDAKGVVIADFDLSSVEKPLPFDLKVCRDRERS
jgi:hypothetical protein